MAKGASVVGLPSLSQSKSPALPALRRSGIMPAVRPLPRFESAEDIEWERARRRVQRNEEREWADALAQAKARAEREEALAWERAIAEAKARTEREEEREWTRRRSAAHSGVVPRVLVPQVMAQGARGRISFWP